MPGGETGAEGPVTLTVDARALFGSGIGRYLQGVLEAVLADARFARVTLLGDRHALGTFVDERGAADRAVVESFPLGLYDARVQLAWLVRRLREGEPTDVSFFPHFDAPILLPLRSVVTVHDLIHFKVPEFFPRSRRLLGGLLLDRVIGGAARVLTVSESTRRDLVERIPGAAGKIEVVPNGVRASFHRLAESEVPDRIRSLRPFLLCVGNRKPHKNLLRAVETLALLRADHPDLRLVVAGGEVEDGWEEVMRAAGALGVADAIVDVRGVDDAELRALYSACVVFLFPSLYEGFGLPLLEAMACGAPVVASNASAVPEVVGDAALLVDPRDAEAMAAAVRRVLTDDETRAGLVERGGRRVRLFSEGSAARRTADALYATARGR